MKEFASGFFEVGCSSQGLFYLNYSVFFWLSSRFSSIAFIICIASRTVCFFQLSDLTILA